MSFADDIMNLRYAREKEDGTKETWEEICKRVVESVFSVVEFEGKEDVMNQMIQVMVERKFIAGGRFLAQAGRDYHQTNNCFLLRAEDTREGWGELMHKAAVMLMSGGGLGVDYSAIRPKDAPLKRSGGVSSGTIPLMRTINEIGRGVMAGGKRRSAIWAGLRWNHGDVMEFINAKNWSKEVKALKEKDYDFPAALDMTNISVILDKDFFAAYDDENNPNHAHAQIVYWTVIENMVKSGEPAFSVDYENPNESLRNACCEIVSEDDSDVCCLGSINLPRIKDLIELKRVVELGTLFLLVGTEYSDSPHPKVKEVKQKNRRLGLGLMGIHEWLIRHGYKYEPNGEFAHWLHVYERVSDETAEEWANKLGFNVPIKKRAIAPNGTISIAGGQTTSGIEPIFSIAYQRRYITPEGHKKQYVVDFVAEKLYEEGYDISTVEDAYTLSLNVEKRIAFQAFVQQYVDNAISSTINMPAYGTLGNNDFVKFGEILYPYLPKLRGITVYPEGARGGQPLMPVDFDFAVSNKDVVFEGNEDCAGGVCGV
jgi:ribonucleoside-diphosphate reductase alpha chain